MTDVHSLTAELRERAGKGAARSTRRAGRVPGVVYGNKATPTLISLEPREIDREIHKTGYYTTLFDIKVNGATERVLPRDVHFDPVTDRHRRRRLRWPPADADVSGSAGSRSVGTGRREAHGVEPLVDASGLDV